MKEKDFRRQTGIKMETYEKMVLMTLEYLREYRTYFYIGKSYGVSESYAYKITKWVEEVLIKDGLFALPEKKALLKNEIEQEVILIDATETPIERPKGAKVLLFRNEKATLR